MDHSPGHPLTLAQASRQPDLLLYQEITGLFPGKNNWGAIIEAMALLRQKYPDQDLKAVLPEYWAAWQRGRRKDGQSYDRFSLPWLTEWAASGVIPARVANPPGPGPAQENLDLTDYPDLHSPNAATRRRAVLAAVEAGKGDAAMIAIAERTKALLAQGTIFGRPMTALEKRRAKYGAFEDSFGWRIR